MSRTKNYKKLSGVTSIWQHRRTKHYYVEKKVKGKTHSETFQTLYEAKNWRKTFDGISWSGEQAKEDSCFATLREVFESMQKHHFPSLATSTQRMWLRRYKLWENIDHTPMDQITPSKITSWVNYWTEHFKSDDYQGSGRGRAGRCNLNNELNIFVTIFNWYKESEIYEKEALHLTCPVKRKHRTQGFVKPVPDKKKQINLEDAFLFFEYLQPLYKDLAMIQFYTAARIGEIAGLQWETVDLRNRRMLIKYTCIWDDNKKFQELKPFPKNKEARPAYISDEIMEILKRRLAFQKNGCGYVFHVEGNPINYGTILVNYKGAQRKSGVPYSGTHILRHGMAKLAREVGGGLDAVMAMTGHKDIKLADHYSKCDEDDHKRISEKVMKHIRSVRKPVHDHANVISFSKLKKEKYT